MMNCAKITLVPLRLIIDEDEIDDLLWSYLGCLYKNGQILKSYQLMKTTEGYMAIVTLPEDDALDEKYNNIYVSKHLGNMHEFFTISIEIIGEDMDTAPSCTCEKKPDWYMLYADWTDQESPVVCGRCGKSVPLYKLPYIQKEDEYHGTLGWKEAYRDIDSLFNYCLSDRFTYRQMNNVDSQLSKIGMDICREFEKAMDVPFYYYLFHYRKTPTACPACGENWILTGEKTFIDYKCDSCKLVADEV